MGEPLDGSLFGPEQPCFGCSPTHPHGLRMTFEREADAITTRFVPEQRHQGPPGCMHGGLVATLADELAAWAIIGLRDKFGFTATFSGTFHQPVRIGVEVAGVSRIVKDRRRLMDVEVELTQEGAMAFTGEFRFVIPDRAGAEKMIGGPLPDAWARWSR